MAFYELRGGRYTCVTSVNEVVWGLLDFYMLFMHPKLAKALSSKKAKQIYTALFVKIIEKSKVKDPKREMNFNDWDNPYDPAI